MPQSTLEAVSSWIGPSGLAGIVAAVGIACAKMWGDYKERAAVRAREQDREEQSEAKLWERWEQMAQDLEAKLKAAYAENERLRNSIVNLIEERHQAELKVARLEQRVEILELSHAEEQKARERADQRIRHLEAEMAERDLADNSD